jgi:4-diphosphocytidyl-2-C-methyl-D-erythritol kinase
MNLKEIELESFAKINLHLDITGKLDNGYHELYSLFQLIGLSDRIKLKITKNEENKFQDKIKISGNFSCRTEDNLIYKTITEFEKQTGLSFSYSVDVDKHIPDGAGLGGGSSNAAYTLYSINKLLDKPLSDERLIGIAEKIGSDVPFFLKGTTALVKGRGEEIYPLPVNMSSYTVVIVCPDFKIATKEAYDMYDKKGAEYKSFYYSEKEIIALLKNKPSEWGFFNSFNPVLLDKKETYRDIFRIFNEHNCDYSNITGSGSAVFGIFNSNSSAHKAEEIFKTNYPFVWIGNMLAGKPLLDK